MKSNTLVERYSDKKHFYMLTRWLKARGVPEQDRHLFSDYGLCVDGIAIGFLFKTNSAYAYIDNAAADPEVSKETRDIAVRKLFLLLEAEAVKCGYKILFVLANLVTMEKRLRDIGYYEMGEYSYYAKRIQ